MNKIRSEAQKKRWTKEEKDKQRTRWENRTGLKTMAPEEARIRRNEQIRNWDEKHQIRRWVIRVKATAKEKDIPFNLTASYIESITPKMCPVLGIPLRRSKQFAKNDSPSIDRIIAKQGYTKGNVIIVSKLANAIRRDATPEQILAVGQFYQRLFEQRALNQSS